MKRLRILQLTPGTGDFHCGSCLRDSALVRGLRARGHDALMVPLYLPHVLEEQDAPPETPIFLGGISVFLDQKFPGLRNRPAWTDRALGHPRLLRWCARFAGMTSPADLGASTVSMLRGAEGAQARELDRLLAWLQPQPGFDVVCLSNSLLAGMAPRLKKALGAPIVCSLQGEDSFLDGLPEPHRSKAWNLLTECAGHVDQFAAVSQYFAALMQRRLALDPGRVTVTYPGLRVDDFAPTAARPANPTIGYLARLHPIKGLGALVDAFLELKRRGSIPGLRLRAAGAMTVTDARYVDGLRNIIAKAGFAADTEFLPNVTRNQKIEFLRSLTALSVPATYGEAFGAYVLEALAAGVPVVQPDHAAFPEILGLTGGGTLYNPQQPGALANAIEQVFQRLDVSRQHAANARGTVAAKFSEERMTDAFEQVLLRAVQENR